MKRVLLGAGAALTLTAAFAAPAYADFTLTILHVNDFHSRFDPITATDSNCAPDADAAGECFGGIARLKTAIDQERAALEAAGENVILLNAGDNFQGSLFYTYYKGEIIADFLNDMGFTVVATGNHEFDDGPETYAEFLELVNFPVIGGNFDVSDEPSLAGQLNGVIVLDIGGEKVGVIGALTVDTQEIAFPGENIRWHPVNDYVAGAVEALHEGGVNKIVVLSHVGLAEDEDLAAAVTGVDLVVGGHSHTVLDTYPKYIANPDGVEVPVVQAGANGKYLGKITVTWDDDGNVVSAEGAPILIDASITPDEGFAERLAERAQPLEEMKAEVVGLTVSDINGDRNVCRLMECSMGNLVADAQLARVADQGITISIANSGGLRASIGSGPITMGDVLTVLPFSNTLATFELSGADLLDSLESGLSQTEEVAGRFPQVAGLRFSFDTSKPAGERLVGDVLVEEDGVWSPIDPDATYGIVTNNFVRGGGDGYQLFRDNAAKAYDFGPALEEVVVEYIASMGGVYVPYTDGRITDVTPAQDEASEEDTEDEAA